MLIAKKDVDTEILNKVDFCSKAISILQLVNKKI